MEILFDDLVSVLWLEPSSEIKTGDRSFALFKRASGTSSHDLEAPEASLGECFMSSSG